MIAERKGNERPIYSVGHSSHAPETFHHLLLSCGVEILVDVRSRPYSRHAPQFNREVLAGFLEARGISYVYMGDRLGGMPEDPAMYNAEGHVLYSKIARTAGFSSGIEELLALAAERTVAVMCGEEDPNGCHRALLIGRVLLREGVKITHIRGDGRLEDARGDEEEVPGGQTEMFPAEEDEGWKSIRSVLPADRRKGSSRR